AVAAGRPYRDLEDFARRTRLSPLALEALAAAGAFGCFGAGRRESMWAAGAAAAIRPAQLPGSTPGLTAPTLPAMTPVEETVADLWATGIYGTHPLVHLRADLDTGGVLTAAGLTIAPPGGRVVVGGLVTHRQRPETAGGVVFLGLEDETGMANVICPPHVWARYRRVGAESGALLVHGRVERTEGATNLVASRLRRLRVAAAPPSRDFRLAGYRRPEVARAPERHGERRPGGQGTTMTGQQACLVSQPGTEPLTRRQLRDGAPMTSASASCSAATAASSRAGLPRRVRTCTSSPAGSATCSSSRRSHLSRSPGCSASPMTWPVSGSQYRPVDDTCTTSRGRCRRRATPAAYASALRLPGDPS
ncbi:MAG TPA: hypothetical protein VGD68_08625, partial [Streptosporangiaceae bacterium]